MKLGDKKQAIGLGIGAVFAVGMLAKTAFGTIGTQGLSHPIAIRDFSSPATRSNNSSEVNVDTSVSTKNPLTIPPSGPASKEDLTTVKRDAFEKPTMPTKTKGFDSERPQARVNHETYTNGKIDPADPGVGAPDPIKGSLPNPDQGQRQPGGASSGPDVTQKPKDIMRYDGYVEAGSPMGIITMNGHSTSVNVGEEVGFGFRVESISSKEITLRKGKKVKTILIGKETQI